MRRAVKATRRRHQRDNAIRRVVSCGGAAARHRRRGNVIPRVVSFVGGVGRRGNPTAALGGWSLGGGALFSNGDTASPSAGGASYSESPRPRRARVALRQPPFGSPTARASFSGEAYCRGWNWSRGGARGR